MARGLDENIVTDLVSVGVNNLLQYIKKDDTLDLEIRDNYLNIYYRGHNVLKIDWNRKNKEFITKAEEDYPINNTFLKTSIYELSNSFEAKNWDKYFPSAKQKIDNYHKRATEREFQQLVVRENNYSSISIGADYFILDFEYETGERKSDLTKFDLIAVEWSSKGWARGLKKDYKPKLVIIEVKYGDGSLNNEKAGILDHIEKFKSFKQKRGSNDFKEFKSEMLKVFKQKRKLGLIRDLKNNTHEVKRFHDDIKMIFLLINHKPAKTVLKEEVKKIQTICGDQNIEFFTSNFMGYGLYEKNVVNIDRLLNML